MFNRVDANSMRPHSSAASRGLRGPQEPSVSPGIGFLRASPTKKDQKHVVFQLIDIADPRIQARLPMRVMISHHDTTESIITTVKNFYGLYDQDGVSFENKEGISIIAAYDNFENDMVVYVRTVSQPVSYRDNGRESTSPKKPTLGAPIELRPSSHATYSPSRAAARSIGRRSMSPHDESDQRSLSAAPGSKPRPVRTKSRDNVVGGENDGYSSGDNGEGSVTSSRRSKTEQVNAEISVDNIVEGGRRKRAFESSVSRDRERRALMSHRSLTIPKELPLFVPPQVPMSTSISSVSPQRRTGPGNAASPHGYHNQQTFTYTQALPSPVSYGSGPGPFYSAMLGGTNLNGAPAMRGNVRQSINYSTRYPTGGVMPTPDPTVNSVISDEDVALQLMRLGDPAAFSHGRTSTSTVDDAFSGKAEATSSDEDEEDVDVSTHQPVAAGRLPAGMVGPQRKKQRTMNEIPSEGTSGEEYEDHRDGTFGTTEGFDEQRRGSKGKTGKHSGHVRAPSVIKPRVKTPAHQQQAPMSPSSLPAQSRKPSVASTINFQHQLADDEEDLSSKPRCQRCRKSKKGCDRQRPCGRCKDAGIGIEGCVSEDEGNGRKGRYGRHMGVPVKKTDEIAQTDSAMPTPMPNGGFFLAPAIPDKNKKRKR